MIYILDWHGGIVKQSGKKLRLEFSCDVGVKTVPYHTIPFELITWSGSSSNLQQSKQRHRVFYVAQVAYLLLVVIDTFV